MKKVYILCGLGVDKRVFNNFKFDGLDVEYIDWIPPTKKESLSAYARRLANHIQHKEPILIGLSFGGMVAMEIAKIIEVKKVILIASAKNKYELPFYFRIIGKIGLNKVIPAKLLKSSNYITNWFFGAQTKEEKLLLKSILHDTNPIFLKWAINEIINWDNTVEPVSTIHIHGNSDRILPISYTKADYYINQGGHFMTINKSKEIEEIIQHIIINL
ncbi:alpha/beta hydrolase [Myroides marinus]|uniref:alpha/beta hydrolase n=1 Tax=Myroides marinus TaxID=703342 RepID=UPI002575D9A5|nr:alpha/beta hydrolase [Myroides marinus]MDM1377866.1 alpha/beta hydrolase [Myroides marinus]MDM1384930.1 alpha/beta hydrolase [Myroides marinus]MDM1392350.1 alpha/beta hydrolase [Myroides marinus]